MPLFIQWILLYLNGLGVVFITGYLDYNSTMSGMKRGTVKEGNPWLAEFIEWSKERGGWLWLKMFVATAVGVAGVYILPQFVGLQLAVWILIGVNFLYYALIVARNYFIAR